MTKTAELDQLIIENMLDLDTAAKRIEDLGSRVYKQVLQEIEKWARKEGWTGEYREKGEPWTAPSDWVMEGKKEASFYVGQGPDDPGVNEGQWPYFWLTRYIGIGTGQLCLWLDQKVTGARKWRPVAKLNAEALARGGFHLSDDGNFYLPCSLDPGILAAALADDNLSAAMGPIHEALNRAAQAKPRFDILFEKARQA